MTTKQIGAELERARVFAESVAAALEAETDTTALAELETALNSARSVVMRLQARLDAQARKEADAAPGGYQVTQI